MDKILKLEDEILTVSKTSAAQEENRSEILLKKSDYLMKYISATFVIINALCVFAVTQTSISSCFIFIYYIVTGISLLLSTFFTINAQTLVESKFFPTGQDVLKSIQHNSNKPYTLSKSKTDTIKYYSKYTEALKNSNDKRAKSIKRAYRYYFVGIFFITVGSFLMIVLIA